MKGSEWGSSRCSLMEGPWNINLAAAVRRHAVVAVAAAVAFDVYAISVLLIISPVFCLIRTSSSEVPVISFIIKLAVRKCHCGCLPGALGSSTRRLFTVSPSSRFTLAKLLLPPPLAFPKRMLPSICQTQLNLYCKPATPPPHLQQQQQQQQGSSSNPCAIFKKLLFY